MPRGLLLTGVSGVGKSAVAAAAGRALSSVGSVVAVVDTDALAQFGPPPPHVARDGRRGFYDGLKCANLAAVWAVYRDAGAAFVVVAAGVDDAGLRAQYEAALVGCAVQCVRLTLPLDVVRSRLAERDDSAAFERHLKQLYDEQALMDRAAAEDFQVASDRPVDEVAQDIIQQLGW